jgi:signal transduction histidine kinase
VRSPAILVMAFALSMLVTLVGMSPWAFGQHRLAQWRVPDSQVRWVPATRWLLPRQALEGETLQRTGRLPFGDPSSVQVVHRFRLPSPGAEPLAVLLPAVDGAVILYANGVPLREGLEASAAGVAWPSARRRFWEIPPSHLHPGENRINVVVSAAAVRVLSSPIYLGPAAELAPVAVQGGKVIDVVRAVVLVSSFVALVLNLLAVAVRAPAYHLAMAAAFAAILTRVLLAEGAEPLGRFWPVVDQLLIAATAICAGLALGVGPGAGQRQGRAEAVLIIVVALMGIVSLIAATKGATGFAPVGAATALASLLCLLLAAFGAVPRRSILSRRGQILSGAVGGLGLATVAIVAAGVAGMTAPGPAWGVDVSLATGLAGLALLASAAAARQVAVRVGRLVRARLDQTQVIARQQAALQATALALDQKSRQSAVLEERQRMARDVHDGIGGQLVSLIAQVRLGRVNMAQVEQALVGGLSELRLLVDSFDVVGETLAEALASFLDRARQQTTAAGMTLEWNQVDGLGGEIRDPQWILNLYRLMQEAITNAVRHSGGDRVSVTIDTDGRQLTVRIEDNGGAFDIETVKRGRGLANMAHRATDLGGAVAVTPSEPGRGTVVRVEAPLPA